MNFKHIYTTCLFLFFGICHAMAGNPGEFSIVENAAYVFRYDSTKKSSLNNLFIKEIARLNFLNLHRTGYTMEYDLTLEIKLLSGMKLEVVSQFEKKDLTGDIFYKDFNLSDVMLPSLFSFDLIVSNGHNLIDTVQVINLDIADQNSISTEISIGNPHGNLNVEVSNIEFTYKVTDKLAFEKRISAINDYLALSELSVFQLEKAGLIDAENPGELLSTYFKIFDLERYLSMLNDDMQTIDFEIPPGRVQFLDVKLTKLNSNQRRLNTLFQLTLNSRHPSVNRGDLLEAAETITGLQLAYLDELTRQSFFYEPIYQRLAAYFYKYSSMITVSEQLDQYFNFSAAMENSTKTLGEEFNDMLIEKYLLLSDSLIVQEQFHISEILLESADAVCRFTNSPECSLGIYNKLSTTKWGIYDAYLRVATSAMEAGNLDMAKNYLETASGFQSENQTFITTDGFTFDGFEKLAWKYFEKGNEDYKSELFGEAFFNFTQSLEIYRVLGILKYDELLSRKIVNAKKGSESVSDFDPSGF